MESLWKYLLIVDELEFFRRVGTESRLEWSSKFFCKFLHTCWSDVKTHAKTVVLRFLSPSMYQRIVCFFRNFFADFGFILHWSRISKNAVCFREAVIFDQQ